MKFKLLIPRSLKLQRSKVTKNYAQKILTQNITAQKYILSCGLISYVFFCCDSSQDNILCSFGCKITFYHAINLLSTQNNAQEACWKRMQHFYFPISDLQSKSFQQSQNLKYKYSFKSVIYIMQITMVGRARNKYKKRWGGREKIRQRRIKISPLVERRWKQ